MASVSLSDYTQMIAGLQSQAAYPHPAERLTHLETHASHVFLAGDFAYKIKKPVNLGFLDFSTLERRRFFCGEELRLNRRLAPDTYLSVVPITGTPEAPKVAGLGEALEYAVMMRRFPQGALFSRRQMTPEIVDQVAERLAEFHANVPVAPPDSPYGTPEAVLASLLENLAALTQGPVGAAEVGRIQSLSIWLRSSFPSLRGRIEQRRRDGWVRECHGDLHLGNIAEVDGRLILFDGIEFDPALRWIDTINEVAFLAMDLAQAEGQPLARRFINHYLERAGDYGGVGLLDLYQIYRATVRAKVIGIRLSQPGLDAGEVVRHRAECVRYLAQAEVYTATHNPRLILTHGRSGSGKTRLALLLRERLRLIHLRSDIERKRLFGLAPEARAGAAADSGIYTPEATRRTYGRLLELTASILGAGYSVLVDATFLSRAQRRPFIDLARDLGVRCAILSSEAPDVLLRARVAQRLAEGSDASDADLAIIEAQRSRYEPPGPEEADEVLPVSAHPGADLEALCARLGDGCLAVLS